LIEAVGKILKPLIFSSRDGWDQNHRQDFSDRATDERNGGQRRPSSTLSEVGIGRLRVALGASAKQFDRILSHGYLRARYGCRTSHFISRHFTQCKLKASSPDQLPVAVPDILCCRIELVCFLK